MKNTTYDLNNYLFEQIERLQDDSMDDQSFQREIERSKAVTGIAAQIVKNGELQLKAANFSREYYGKDTEVPLLGIKT